VSTATTEVPSHRWRAYAQIAALAGWLALCLPPHLLTKWLTGDSRWPRRFLAGVAHIVGVRARVEGEKLRSGSFVVANHVSWLDIVVMAGTTGSAFVSKAEVKRVPLIGWLADQNRTVYVDRSARSESHDQIRRIGEALTHPQPLAVFPEGTTGDGTRLLPFRTTLLHAVAPPPDGAVVRPVALDYHEAVHQIAWVGGEPGVRNAMRVLGRRGTMRVTVRLLEALPPHHNRKILAQQAHAAISAALPSLHGGNGL
jgi:lyso-ornithine lipid O-acyltransferase